MPRAVPLTDQEFGTLEKRCILEGGFSRRPFYRGDFKRSNYGTLNGKIIRLDYGEHLRN